MPNTALNRTTQALLTNKSGGALNYGDVVVLDNTNDNGFTTTTTAGLSTRGLGVILEPNGIANNATGMVAIGGWCPQVNLNTAATDGQFIKTHTVAGQGTPHASPQVEGDFAVALTASATPAAMLFGSANGPTSGGAGTVTNTGTLTAGQLIQGNGTVDVTVATTGTGVLTALGTNVGSAGAFVTNGGALGTPSSGTLTNVSGLPAATGLTGVVPGTQGGGLVLVEQHTASNSASLDFTTAISATYDDYVVRLINIIAQTDGATLLLRMGNGSFDSGANYTRCGWYMGVGDALTGYTATAQTGISIANSYKTGGSLTINGVWHLYNPANASVFKQATGEASSVAVGTTNLYKWGLSGSWNSTTAADRFQFIFSSGNIVSGTIRVYGVAQ